MNALITKLQNKPIILLAVIGIFSVIVIGWNVFVILWIDEAMTDIIHRVEEAAELEETLVFIFKQEVVEQQYLLTGELTPLIRHKQFETLADFHLNQAHRLQSNREEMTIIEEIHSNRDAYEAIFDQIVVHYNNGDIDEAIRLSFEEAEKIIEETHRQLQAFVFNLEQQLETSADRVNRLAWVSLVISLVLLVVFIGIIYISISINNRTLKYTLLLAVAISLIVVSWNLYNIWRLTGSVQDVVTLLKELDQIALAEISLLEQEVAELEYLLSGNDFYIERHREIETITNDHWRRAVSLQTTADEQNLLTGLKQDHDAYEQTFNAIVAAYQQGDKAEATRLSIEEASVTLDDVQQRIDQFINRTELRLEAQLSQVDQLTAVALTIGVFTLIILTMEAIISTTTSVQVQIQQLRIEIDEIKRKKQVDEIVETDFFQDLQTKAGEMRHKQGRRKEPKKDTPTES